MTHLRRNLKWAAAVVLVADLGLAAWLLSPRAPSQAATQQQLTAARAEWIALKAEVAQLGRLRGRINTSEDQMRQLMDAGMPPQSSASSDLLAEFSRLAGASGVEVSGAQFDPDKDARLGLRRVVISLNVSGGYRGVVTFLNQIERSPMFFLINQVSVSGGRAAGPQAGDQVKLEVRIEAYERTAAA